MHARRARQSRSEEVEHSADDPTVQEVYDSMTEEQKEVVHYMVGAALESSARLLVRQLILMMPRTKPIRKPTSPPDDDKNEEEGRRMTRNVFEQQSGGNEEEKHVLTHDAIKGIVADAQKGGSLKEAVEAYALAHGIDNIDVLFPDARALTDTPEFDNGGSSGSPVSSTAPGTPRSPASSRSSPTSRSTRRGPRVTSRVT